MRRNLEATLSNLDAESRKIDGDERGSWLAWAKDPEGDPPQPKAFNNRRQALAQKRKLAANDLAGTLDAGPRIEALNAELRAIEARIFGHKLESVMTDVRGTHMRVCEDAARLSDGNARMRRFIKLITELQGTVSGDARAHLQTARVEFDALKTPKLNVDQAAVNEHADEWRRQLLSK
jgi:hypothetical protein